MKKKDKPNCYECRWRGHVPGDAHSKCCHPYNKPLLDNAMLQMLGVFASVGREVLPPMADKRLKIQANESGVRHGWFHYPFNFDPVWLDACSGFEAIKDNDPRVLNKHRAKDSYGDAKTCEQPTVCEDCELRFKCFTERENGIHNDI